MTPKPAPGRRFVGRDREMAELLGGLEQAIAGRGCFFALVGEPGIGKSRLADELANRASQRDVRVLWGRCWEGGGAPAFWPWAQMIRSHARSVGSATLAADAGAGAPHIARIVPQLRERLSCHAEVVAADDPEERLGLFDAVTTLFANAATRTPLLLVLDDLHAADRPSVLLLRFFAHLLREMRILVLATLRDGPALDRELAELAAALTRHGRMLPLGGLTSREAATFVEETSGRPPSEDLVTALHQATGGNPFFLDEVVRLMLASTGHDMPLSPATIRIPDRVLDVVRRRLSALGPECRTALRAAAVLGREFELDRLALVAGVAEADLWRILEEARAAGTLVLVSPAIGRYGFRHALVREALHDEVDAPTRCALHLAVARSLEAATPPDGSVFDLAHHYFEALPAGDRARAADCALQAGDQANAQLAYETASLQYRRVLEVLGADPTERHCEVLLRLADALWRGGESAAARDTFLRAAEESRRLRDGARLARAALGFGATRPETGQVDTLLLALLEESLATLGHEEPKRRAELLARLSVALTFAGAPKRRMALSREALETARRADDCRTLGLALAARHFVLWGPTDLGERVAVSSEMVRLAMESGDRLQGLEARAWRILDLLESGEIEELDAEIELYAGQGAATRVPRYVWHLTLVRAMRALLAGRLPEAERLAGEALGAGRGDSALSALQFYGVQLYTIRREQGRLAEIEASVSAFAGQLASLPIWRCGTAALLAELGREEECRREFDALAEGDFALLPRDMNWLPALSLLAGVCAFLGDERRADVLHGLLEPYAARTLVVGTSAACWGPISLSVGLLEATMGRLDDALRRFDDALAATQRLRGPLLAAHVRFQTARVLLRRGAARDRERTAALLDEAAESARHMGAARLLERAEAARAAGVAAPPRRHEAGANLFRREGDYWTISYDGHLIRQKRSKGLEVLARLLRNPGREFHVSDLVQAGPVGSRRAAARNGSSDAGEAIDARAKGEYRRRLAAIRDELGEAERFNDCERATRLREEMARLASELAASLGLHGRSPRVGSELERTRLMVTKRVLSAIARLRTVHPALARYLSTTIRTGAFCRYDPDPDRPVVWAE